MPTDQGSGGTPRPPAERPAGSGERSERPERPERTERPANRPRPRPAPVTAGPVGARLIGALLALAGVALLVVGLITLNGRDGDDDTSAQGASPSASAASSTAGAPATSAATTPSAPATTAESTTVSTTAPPTTGSTSATPSPTTGAPPRAPLTILNNSTINGLGERAAGQIKAKGWTIPVVGNFAGRIPVTTVYYNPGNAAQQKAALELQKEFPQIQRVFERYEGLPPTPPGIVLVVTRDWG